MLERNKKGDTSHEHARTHTHTAEVAQESDSNMMTCKNLAIVFAPNVLRMKVAEERGGIAESKEHKHKYIHICTHAQLAQ